MKSIINENQVLYLLCFFSSLVVSFIATPVVRKIALKLNILDHPHSKIKTHTNSIPYLGGLGIWIGWITSLFIIRFFTHFPTGTLRSIRGIIWGSTLILSLGLIDDILPKGLDFKKKFLIQILAAIGLFLFDIRLHFVQPYSVAIVLSIIWIVAVTNAFNIVDIMDGLSGGLALIASLAFLFISIPTEQIYVNFSAAALSGACLGFLPYNFSKKRKIFMGDTGSLTLGFVLASISMGTSYTETNEIALLAPFIILALPIYDTILVMYMRLKKGQSPFLGSKDHFALRLEIMGFSRKKIITISYIASLILAFGAFLITRISLLWAIISLIIILSVALIISYWLGKVKVE